MIESNRSSGTFEVFCDQVGCTESKEFYTDGDWHQMIAELKAEGWRIIKEDSGYSHMCPNCIEESRSNRI